jgi:hypothetical protein
MQQHFETFMGMVAAATTHIGGIYFQLPVAGLEDAIYRERVYCYELYHWIRNGWNGFDFSLGGEVDKTGHPLFREGEYAQSKPDFLVHRPGDMDRNLACVEVKPSIRSVGDFRDDLKKLTWFCRNARYYGGIFLVYGVEEQETQELDRLRMKIGNAANDPDVDLGRISLLHHARVEEQARVVTL